jgi:hypothetical protein
VYSDKSGGANSQWLNPVAFGQPDSGTLGNLGRVTIILPAAWQWDLALARTFRLHESQSVEFRAEAYNWTTFRPGQMINTSLTGPIRQDSDGFRPGNPAVRIEISVLNLSSDPAFSTRRPIWL